MISWNSSLERKRNGEAKNSPGDVALAEVYEIFANDDEKVSSFVSDVVSEVGG